jgi:hypothetical protein
MVFFKYWVSCEAFPAVFGCVGGENRNLFHRTLIFERRVEERKDAGKVKETKSGVKKVEGNSEVSRSRRSGPRSQAREFPPLGRSDFTGAAAPDPAWWKPKRVGTLA